MDAPTRGNYDSGEDFVLEYGELRFTFNETDFSERCEQAGRKLGFVRGNLDTGELEDLVNLAVNGDIQEPASALGEHVNDCWPELVGPADRSLVHWLRRLVFRSAWLDQRVTEGELDVRFDGGTLTFRYVQPDRGDEPLLYTVAEGDPRDPVWTPAPIDPPPLSAPHGVAVSIDDALPPAIKATLRRAASHLREAGYDVEEVSPPGIERLSELWADIGLAEIGAMLRPIIPATRDEGMQVFMETFWQLRGDHDLATYQAALREREAILIKWQVFLDTHPLILMPSCAEHSLPVGIDTQGKDGVTRMLNALKYQLAIPVLGLPSLAVPMGLHDGLPNGIQIVTRRFREDLCLAAGEIIEAREAPITPIDVKW